MFLTFIGTRKLEFLKNVFKNVDFPANFKFFYFHYKLLVFYIGLQSRWMKLSIRLQMKLGQHLKQLQEIFQTINTVPAQD